jgi:hypothetical protein
MAEISSLLLSEAVKTHKITILYVILYGYETLLPALREGHKLRMLEHMLLGRICGSKKKAETGNWRRLNKEKLRKLCSSPHMLRVITF